MTHKEKIIATAYTGIMFVEGSELGEVYAYEAEKLGHGVVDIMHANKDFQQKVRAAVREDFLAMISKNEETKEETYKTDTYTFETLKEVENEIDNLLEAQPDAQILSIFVDHGWYKVIVRRRYGGWID